MANILKLPTFGRNALRLNAPLALGREAAPAGLRASHASFRPAAADPLRPLSQPQLRRLSTPRSRPRVICSSHAPRAPSINATAAPVFTGPFAIVQAAAASVVDQFERLDGLWGRFIPMSALFFMMAFVNTIIDSLKDSLVITAVGGGTEVLPYLSVYGVLPCSVLFLVAYSWGTQRYSRERLFNVIIGSFLAFYAAFGLAYPHHEVLHLSTWADALVKVLPTGLGGMVGMVRNWLFTLFYLAAELWGDIVLSLLFWGLANETTSIEDAPLLYPLFGVGANIAQTMAGRALRVFSDSSGVHFTYTHQLQATVGLCVVLGLCIVSLHAYISRTFPKNPKGSTAAKAAKAAAAKAAEEANQERLRRKRADFEATVQGLNYCDVEEHQKSSGGSNGAVALANGKLANGQAAHLNAADAAAAAAATTAASSSRNGSSSSSSSSSINSQQSQAAEESSSAAPPAAKIKKAMSLVDAWDFLRRSPQIRCLAIMAVAQGITTRILEVTFKHYLHMLHSTPQAYAAFLGDTAMWTGIVTGSLMFTSPMMFDKVGWRGVASTTPTFMLWGGVPFFIGCLAYNFMSGSALTMGAVTLKVLVVTGALMQVLSRGAKFSLFKPAEEMVYIGLDDESRSKGKAAIDVVGAQSGKSVGSIMQQALLILTGGTVGGILPVLAVFYVVMLNRWNSAVADLAEHHDPAHVHRQSIMGSLDEADASMEQESGDEAAVGAPAAAA